RMVCNERLREIKVGLSSIVASKWLITRKIGEGAFGLVFECICTTKPSVKRALKAEICGLDRSHESLNMEIYVMRKMMSVKAVHSVQLFGAGSEKNYNFVVMTLLGLSLSDIRKRLPNEKFTLESLIIIGVQSTDSLREMHSAGFVHRDIKPSNYTIGKDTHDWIYLIDFGISREIMYTEDLMTKLKCPRRSCQFRGTTRYCSINAHRRKELGRHDDLISMMYMLIEGHLGALPWKQKDRPTTERLKTEKEEEMIGAIPKPFKRIFEYLKELTYFLTPDYKRVRQEFLEMAKERKMEEPFKLDWDEIVAGPYEKEPTSTTVKKSLSQENLNQPADLTTMYDIPDEFPHEDSCSDSDRTIPSAQEQRVAKVVMYRTEEKTQSDDHSLKDRNKEKKVTKKEEKREEKGWNDKQSMTASARQSMHRTPSDPCVAKHEKKEKEK
ncbi:hypothetical protein PFISCL1PPCAC_15182, partial [Pristionchus fissidentatus]